MRKTVAILMVLVLIMSLAACENGTPEGTTRPTTPTTPVSPNPTTNPTPDSTEPTQPTAPATESSVPGTSAPTEPVPTEPQPTEPTSGPDVMSYDANDLESILAYIKAVGEQACTVTEEETKALLEQLGDTYADYNANKSGITYFLETMQLRASELYAAFQICNVDYFKCVAAHGLEDYDYWDNALDDLYDEWDDAMEAFYEAWDEACTDIYEQCDKLLTDAAEEIGYSEYYDQWSAMYQQYMDNWSSMYDIYSNAWSKTYRDYSACWSGFYRGETDVDAILAKAAEEEREEESTEPTEPEETPDAPAENDGIRPEFKEAMDSYEAFFDSYVLFMKAYKESDDVASMAAEYSAMMMQYAETITDLYAVDQSTLSEEEVLYYMEVILRINEKLLQVV